MGAEELKAQIEKVDEEIAKEEKEGKIVQLYYASKLKKNQ